MTSKSQMMKAALFLGALGVATGCSNYRTTTGNTTPETDAINQYEQDALEPECRRVIDLYRRTDGTLAKFFDNSIAYAVYPAVSKAGVGIGGANGVGLLFEGGDEITGTTTLSQFNIGAQIGGQTFAQIVFFETPEKVARFKANELELTANISAVIVEDGSGATSDFQEAVAVFVKPKEGFMLDLSLGGQEFNYEPMK
ncbi:MAG: hypothetical protein AAGB34_10060 [Planctomycetota bacterium]